MGNHRIGASVSTLRDATPNADDLAFTRAARQTGRLLGIELLDHVVIARATWTSIAA